MNVHTAMLTRRTVHTFDARPVPGAIVERALESARWAPNHKLTNPWRFYVFGENTKLRVAEIAAALAEEKQAAAIDAHRIVEVRDAAKKKLMEVPVVIAVSSRRVPGDAFREREDYAATACAIQNMQLSFWADGVGAKWSSGKLTREPRVYSALGAEPTREELIGFLKAGYPAEVPTMKRKPLAEVVLNLP